MKKIIIALGAFLAVLAVSIAEIVCTTEAYSLLADMSERVNNEIRVCVECKQTLEKQLSTLGGENEETLKKAQEQYSAATEGVESVKSEWKKRKAFVSFFGNHTIVKSIDERISSLSSQCAANAWEDAFVTSAALSTYFSGLKDDTHPVLSNLL